MIDSGNVQSVACETALEIVLIAGIPQSVALRNGATNVPFQPAQQSNQQFYTTRTLYRIESTWHVEILAADSYQNGQQFFPFDPDQVCVDSDYDIALEFCKHLSD